MEVDNTGGPADRASYVTQTVSLYNTAGLADNAQSICWAFTANNLTGLEGYDTGEDGMAFVLGATNDTLTSGQGYAVVFDRNNAATIELVHYMNGLDADANMTPVISMSANTGGNSSASVKITFDPLTNTWTMYRTTSSGSGELDIDPRTTTTGGMSAVDATYTSSSFNLQYTGFYVGGNGGEDAQFNNYYIQTGSFFGSGWSGGTPAAAACINDDCGNFCSMSLPGVCYAHSSGSVATPYLCVGPGNGTICGLAFLDDLDGIKELGTDDAPIDNVYVLLFDENGNIIGRTNTDPSGNYCFTGIPNGTYYVAFAPPAASPNATLQNNTGDGNTDSDLSQASFTSHLIYVDTTVAGTNTNDSTAPTQNTTNVDAGFTPGVTISGILYLDADFNDTFGLAETNIISDTVAVYLYDEGSMMYIDTVYTTAGGINTGATYTFLNVNPGTYTVELDTLSTNIPADLSQGTPGTVSGITVTATESVGGINFGFNAFIDLELIKTVNIASPLIGTDVVFTLTVANTGALEASAGVVVSDLLPSGFSYVSDDGGGAYVPGTGLWTIPSPIAANGGTAMLNITVTVQTTGNYTNIAEIMSATGQQDADSTFGNGPDTNPGSGIGSADADSTQDPLDEDDADDAFVNPKSCEPSNGRLIMGGN